MTVASGRSELANSCHPFEAQREGRDGGCEVNGQQGEGQGRIGRLSLLAHAPLPGPWT